LCQENQLSSGFMKMAEDIYRLLHQTILGDMNEE
jgi:hypothetical protein